MLFDEFYKKIIENVFKKSRHKNLEKAYAILLHSNYMLKASEENIKNFTKLLDPNANYKLPAIKNVIKDIEKAIEEEEREKEKQVIKKEVDEKQDEKLGFKIEGSFISQFEKNIKKSIEKVIDKNEMLTVKLSEDYTSRLLILSPNKYLNIALFGRRYAKSNRERDNKDRLEKCIDVASIVINSIGGLYSWEISESKFEKYLPRSKSVRQNIGNIVSFMTAKDISGDESVDLLDIKFKIVAIIVSKKGKIRLISNEGEVYKSINVGTDIFTLDFFERDWLSFKVNDRLVMLGEMFF